jgi:hypothetical protein
VNGRDFLIIANQYSGWPDVIPFPNKNTTACRDVDALREYFIRGPRAPVKFWSDIGPNLMPLNSKILQNTSVNQKFSTPLPPVKRICRSDHQEHEETHRWFMEKWLLRHKQIFKIYFTFQERSSLRCSIASPNGI